MFAALGRFAYRARWVVLGTWALVLLAGALLGGQLFDRLATVDNLRPDAESVRAEQRIMDLVDAGPVVFAVVAGVDPYSPSVVESVSQVSGEITKIPGVVDVTDLYTGPGGLIGRDGQSTLVSVELSDTLSDDELVRVEDQVRVSLASIAAPTVLVGGDHLAQRAFGEQAIEDLVVGESVAFVLLVVALLVIFGGAVAASIPLGAAVLGVSATLLALLGVSAVADVGEYAVNIVTLLGIGLALDYALLIIARYREERAAGADAEQALVTAMSRAGRAVAVAGSAVVVAFAGLAVFAEPLLASMALGGAAVGLLTTVIALTAVPALIAVAGRRIPPAGAQTWVTRAMAAAQARMAWRGSRGPRASLLVRLAGVAQRHPQRVAVSAALGLIALALPLAGANFANSDARALPASSEARRAYEAHRALFSRDAAPVTVVAEAHAESPEVRDYLNELNQLTGVQRLDLRHDVPVGWVIVDLIGVGETAGAPSQDLVRHIRAAGAPFPVEVTGPAAAVVDYQNSITTRLPYVVVMVVLAMLVLLFLLTRSLVVPVKAIGLNALTFLATLGVLVVLFQWGWGEPLLRFTSWGAIDLTTPLLLFVFIFALSIDYEVFLLSRMTEEYERRGDNDQAVLAGIARSGPVVTAAAVCITIVFLGFAAGELVAVKEIGVGLAIAVILDVTVVRGLLLPAVMTLLGDLNWWSPGRTRWLGRAGGGRPSGSGHVADAAVEGVRAR